MNRTYSPRRSKDHTLSLAQARDFVDTSASCGGENILENSHMGCFFSLKIFLI
jgi:hypothetical protein